MHLYFKWRQKGKKKKKVCFLVIFLLQPVSRWPKINCIRKEPQVLHSNSHCPHKKTRCATRHLCLFLFSTSHKNRLLQQDRSAAQVIMKILERLILSHLPSLRELLSWWWTKATTSWTWQPWLLHQQPFWRILMQPSVVTQQVTCDSLAMWVYTGAPWAMCSPNTQMTAALLFPAGQSHCESLCWSVAELILISSAKRLRLRCVMLWPAAREVWTCKSVYFTFLSSHISLF